MRLFIRVALGALLLTSCRSAPVETFSPAHQTALADSVTQVMRNIARDISAQGFTAWIHYLETAPRFIWTSDGSIEFPTADSLVRFIRGFAATLTHTELTWDTVIVAPLAPGAGMATTRYREMWVDQRGDTTHVHGVFVGVLANGANGWRIVSGNTSHASGH